MCRCVDIGLTPPTDSGESLAVRYFSFVSYTRTKEKLLLYSLLFATIFEIWFFMILVGEDKHDFVVVVVFYDGAVYNINESCREFRMKSGTERVCVR